jgi:hypothetical protein
MRTVRFFHPDYWKLQIYALLPSAVNLFHNTGGEVIHPEK